MKDEVRTLFRRLKEKNMLPMSSKKYIIFNKYDKVIDVENVIFKRHKQEIVDLIENMFEEKNISQYCINSKSLNGIFKTRRIIL